MYNLQMMSDIPLYQQIVDQTKEMVRSGFLVQGDKMPSVRDLAKQLQVNTATITRAYSELEKMGVLQPVVGKGTFISIDQEKTAQEQEKMRKKLIDCLREAYYSGLTRNDLEEIIGKFIQEVENDKN